MAATAKRFILRHIAPALAVLLAGCAGVPKGDDVQADIRAFAYQNLPRNPLPGDKQTLPFTAGSGGAAIASSDIPWRIPPSCRAEYRRWLADSAEPVADQERFPAALCNAPRKNALVAVAITGGGNKSAVYSAEVLFELQRYGLADSIDAVSSVSGGSFTALLYALSCDPGGPCDAPHGWKRPVWDYTTIRAWLETDYLWPFIGHRFRPDNLYHNIFAHHGADDDLAAVVSARLLKEGNAPLTFADLNPARPNLILNATNVTAGRQDLDQNAAIPADDRRPLTDDEALHFSFTQQYFWRLLSDLDSYPVKEALVASAAFPLIIDRPSLRRYRADDRPILTGGLPTSTPKYVDLYDGGVHDNFGLTELIWFLQCRFDRPDSVAPVSKLFLRRECGADASRLRRPPAALVLGINSSLLRSEGITDDVPKQRSLDTYFLPLRASGVTTAVDMIMAASGEQRKQQLRRLMRDANPPPNLLPPGYGRFSIDNPELRPGPYQYVDFDLEATQALYCEPGRVDRNGDYPFAPPDDRLLNAATGGSDKNRCEVLQGILRWNRDRNLDLPSVLPGFCQEADDCKRLLPLLGGMDDVADSLWGYLSERRAGARLLPGKIFFDPDNAATPRLLSNRLLFDAVRTTPTDFQLAPRYAWLLRYTARWVVARRVWELCQFNRPLLATLGQDVAHQACDAPLPPRLAVGRDPVDGSDRVGSPAYNAVDF